MNYPIFLWLPGPLLLIVFVFLLARKGEFFHKASISFAHTNWISLAAYMLALLITALLLGVHEDEPVGIQVLYWLNFLLFLTVVSFMVQAITGKPKEDEKTAADYTKSARNALLATYLAFIIVLVTANTTSLNKNQLLIIIISGLSVGIISKIFYSFFYKPRI